MVVIRGPRRSGEQEGAEERTRSQRHSGAAQSCSQREVVEAAGAGGGGAQTHTGSGWRQREDVHTEIASLGIVVVRTSRQDCR